MDILWMGKCMTEFIMGAFYTLSAFSVSMAIVAISDVEHLDMNTIMSIGTPIWIIHVISIAVYFGIKFSRG